MTNGTEERTVLKTEGWSLEAIMTESTAKKEFVFSGYG